MLKCLAVAPDDATLVTVPFGGSSEFRGKTVRDEPGAQWSVKDGQAVKTSYRNGILRVGHQRYDRPIDTFDPKAAWVALPNSEVVVAEPVTTTSVTTAGSSVTVALHVTFARAKNASRSTFRRPVHAQSR